MSQQQGFVGSWQVIATDSPGPPNISLATVGADGTVVTSPPPVFPPMDPSGEAIYTSAGHGAWEATGRDSAVVTFVVLTADRQGNPLLTVTVRASVTLDAGRQSWSGEGSRTFTDPGGNIVATELATVRATRIVAATAAGQPPAKPRFRDPNGSL